MLKKTEPVPSTKATTAICANDTRSIASAARLRCGDRTASAASMSRRFQRSTATPAKAEEGVGQDRCEADDPGLRRRVREGEDEQRIRDRGRLRAGVESSCPLEQDEVAVPPQRCRRRSTLAMLLAFREVNP